MRGSTAGLTERLKDTSPMRYACLSFSDVVISSVIVGPAVVGYWRSVWLLMEVYVFPENILLSSLISTAIGNLGHLVFAFSKGFFEKYCHPDRNVFLFYGVSRLYTVGFAFVCVNGWRGPWSILDLYTEMELTSVAASTLVGVIALAAMRTLRNVGAPPFAITMDSVDGYFDVLTMFRVTMKERTSLYILDCLFSVLVVGTLVVFVWRGVWVLMDIFLFPENEIWSSWSSLVLGYLILIVVFLVQPGMKWACDRLEGTARLLAADLFVLFSLISTVNVWRGIWNLLNIYVLPDNLELSCWITHWICLTLLVILGCSNSLLVRGVYIDAEEPAGNCVVFPCYYLRIIFQEDKLKQLQAKNNDVCKSELDNNSKHSGVTELNNVVCVNHSVLSIKPS